MVAGVGAKSSGPGAILPFLPPRPGEDLLPSGAVTYYLKQPPESLLQAPSQNRDSMRGMYSIVLFPFASRSAVVVAAWLAYVSLGLALAAQDLAPVVTPGTQFAPGVLTTIPPGLEPADTVNVHDMVEIRANQQLRHTPNLLSESRTLFEMAKDVEFRQNIWCLEFSFKPLRMLAVDLPQASGKMQRKLIWYMVYRVRNTGAGLAPERRTGRHVRHRRQVPRPAAVHPAVLPSQPRPRPRRQAGPQVVFGPDSPRGRHRHRPA